MEHSDGSSLAPAYQRLAERIQRQIQAGHLGPGARLPSETRLANDAEVSRSTVREALRTLQEAGFIERASPRIMVVAQQRDEPAQRQVTRVLREHRLTFAQLHEALALLEPELSRLAAERAQDADVEELREILAAQELALTAFDEWNRLDQVFHMTIAEIADNAALLIARAPVSRILDPALRDFVTTETATRAGLRWHHRILDQIAERDGEAAALMTKRHVDDFRSAWIARGRDLHQPVDPDDDSVT
jgi:GntR family transcriptional repressor for pyruvate dehydrogenase complex